MLARAFTVIATVVIVSASAYGQATVTHENIIVPLEFQITSCSGETVVFFGEAHVMQHSMTNTNANKFVVHIDFHLQGTGASGTRYVVSEHVNGESTVAGAENLTSEARLVAVAEGSADNLLVHTFIHFTVNANGEITSSRFVFDSECQG